MFGSVAVSSITESVSIIETSRSTGRIGACKRCKVSTYWCPANKAATPLPPAYAKGTWACRCAADDNGCTHVVKEFPIANRDSNLDETVERSGMTSILDLRARDLARPLPQEPLASETLEILTFAVGDEQFGVETRLVTEVLRNVAITPLPGGKTPVIGVTNLRGEVLAVASPEMAMLPATEQSPSESGQWVIVLGVNHPRLGLDVSDVVEVTTMSQRCILDAERSAVIIESGLVRGVTREARIILDGASLLNDPRFVVDESDRN